jgi:hypothetical protein
MSASFAVVRARRRVSPRPPAVLTVNVLVLTRAAVAQGSWVWLFDENEYSVPAMVVEHAFSPGDNAVVQTEDGNVRWARTRPPNCVF